MKTSFGYSVEEAVVLTMRCASAREAASPVASPASRCSRKKYPPAPSVPAARRSLTVPTCNAHTAAAPLVTAFMLVQFGPNTASSKAQMSPVWEMMFDGGVWPQAVINELIVIFHAGGYWTWGGQGGILSTGTPLQKQFQGPSRSTMY